MTIVDDQRARHFWDSSGIIGKRYANVLELPGGGDYAFDVYLVFGPDVVWGEEPPPPTEWMHQLGEDQRTLNGDALRQMVERLSGNG